MTNNISKSNKTITAQDINDNTHNTNNNTSNNNLENTPNCSPVAMLSKSSHSKLNTSTKIVPVCHPNCSVFEISVPGNDLFILDLDTYLNACLDTK